RRPRARGQGPLPRLQQLRGVSADRQLVAVEVARARALRGAAGAVFARGARARARARTAVRKVRARNLAVVAARGRLFERQVQEGCADPAGVAAREVQGHLHTRRLAAQLEDPRGARGRGARGGHVADGGGAALVDPEAGGHLRDHGCAYTGAARRQPEGRWAAAFQGGDEAPRRRQRLRARLSLRFHEAYSRALVTQIIFDSPHV